MNEHGKSDGPVVPAKLPNKAAVAAAEVVEGRDRPRGTRPAKRAPGHSAGQGRPVRWIVCARWRDRTRMCGSRRCCITSMSLVCGAMAIARPSSPGPPPPPHIDVVRAPWTRILVLRATSRTGPARWARLNRHCVREALWPCFGIPPPTPPPLPRPCSPVSQVLRTHLTSRARSSGLPPRRSLSGPPSDQPDGRAVGSPGLAHEDSVHAQVLRPRGATGRLALTPPACGLPPHETTSAPRNSDFAAR